MKGREYKIKKSTKTKEIYYFKFEDDKYPERKVREIFPKKNLEIRYPFYENKQKYAYIESFEFYNISPDEINGVGKSVSRGYGFTKNLAPIIKELEKFPRISKIVISKEKSTKVDKNAVVFNKNDIEKIFNILKPFNDKQYKEKRKITNNLLAELLPRSFQKNNDSYNEGDLLEFIINKDLRNKKISEADVNNIVEIIPDEIKEQKLVYKIEEKIELIKIENARRDLKKLMSQKKETKVLENKWHSFFKKNDWIFSYILLSPVAIYGDEIYVGGKTAKNKDGKVADFLYKNSLTNNACIIEIKTHKSKICNRSSYRGSNVFPLNGNFSGAINQVLIQRNNLLKDYATLLRQEKEAGNADEFFTVFNPKCILVTGSLKELSLKQRNNLDIFRNNLNNIEVITFDEIEEKIDYFMSLLNVNKG